MAVRVFGCNHVAIEVDNIEKAIDFYTDVFNLELQDDGEGDAFFALGNHQFLAIFAVQELQRDRHKHFGIMVRDNDQVAEVKKKITEKYGLKTIPPFRCDFHDPWGNHIQVVDIHDESTAWLQPYERGAESGREAAGLTMIGYCLCAPDANAADRKVELAVFTDEGYRSEGWPR